MLSFTRNWAMARKISQQRMVLEGLTDRQLKDIGVKRRDINAIARQVASEE